MSVSKLILSSARRYIACATVDVYIYKIHSFRHRERERDDDDYDDDIVQHTQPVFRQFTRSFIELNFIIDRVVEDGSITGAWALKDLTPTPTPPPEILSILSVGLFNIHILSFLEWFTTYNV